jgi:hypothetical protein
MSVPFKQALVERFSKRFVDALLDRSFKVFSPSCAHMVKLFIKPIFVGVVSGPRTP